MLPACGLFNDDGITHLFADEIVKFLDQHGPCKNEVMEKFLDKRCVVLMEGSDEHVLENLKKRNQEVQGRKRSDLLAHMDISDAVSRIRKKRAEKDRCFEVVKSLGVPTLKLDASEEAQGNVRKVKNFIESVTRQQRKSIG